jgi:hypothetical protein
LAIVKGKAKAIEEDDEDCTADLDIMEIIVKDVAADDTLKPNEDDFELTCYRKVAANLDIIPKDLKLKLSE